MIILLEATKSRSSSRRRSRSTEAHIDLQMTSQPAHPHRKRLAWFTSPRTSKQIAFHAMTVFVVVLVRTLPLFPIIPP